MIKIGIIGRTAYNKNISDGQTILTRIFADELRKAFADCKIYIVDTYNYKRNALKCFIKTIKCLIVSDYIFVMLSRNGLKFYLPFLYYTNKIFKKKLYHRVIGGSLDKLVIKNNKWIKYLNAFQCNYVETNQLKNRLNTLGISNVKVSPNFKPLVQTKQKVARYTSNDEIRFCTFSRVAREKGITDAVNAIIAVNKLRKKNKVYLDIYGQIDHNYQNEFNELLKKAKYINYKGIIKYDETVQVLNKYYALLFPTYWEGEGFPGTFIDCFASGLPIIATDWNYNAEIIKNNLTGYIYKRDSDNYNLIKEIKLSLENVEQINKMRKNCLKEYKKYNPQNVINEIKKDMILNQEIK